MKKSSIQLMKNSNLIAHNYLGTSFMESLGLNIPTLYFYDSDVYSFSKNFEPYAKKFKKLKVFNPSVDETVKHYLKICKNPYERWYRHDIQSVVKDFQNDFFKVSGNWKEVWGKTPQETIRNEY